MSLHFFFYNGAPAEAEPVFTLRRKEKYMHVMCVFRWLWGYVKQMSASVNQRFGAKSVEMHPLS